MLTAPTARAGQYSVSFSGGTCSDDFGNTFPDYDDGQGDYIAINPNYYFGNPTGIYSAQGTVTSTCTWVPDPGQTLATDPPPQSALVDETGVAYWEANGGTTTAGGTCDDGLGDPPISNTDSLPWVLSGLWQFDNNHYSVHGGKSFKLTRSPSITPGSDGGINGSLFYSVSVSQYNGTISAGSTGQPATTGQPGGADGGGDGGGADTPGGPGPGSLSTVPYFSGTGCPVNATAIPLQGYLLQAQLKINGTLVAEYDDNYFTAPTTNNPLITPAGGTEQGSWTFSGLFDSTHFPDNTPITATLTGIDSTGNPLPPVTIQGSSYNKAVVYGNDVQQGGSLLNGKLAGQIAAASFNAGNAYNVTGPTLGANTGAIKNAIAPNTVFYIDTHGNGSAFGDGLATDTVDEDYIQSGDVSTAVGNKTSAQPPYSFVFIDACDTGTSTLANAFGIPTVSTSDQAYLGFDGVVNDDPIHIGWSNQLLTYLSAGKTVRKAIQDTITTLGNLYTSPGVPVNIVPLGDPNAKTHGVYGGDEGSLLWFSFH